MKNINTNKISYLFGSYKKDSKKIITMAVNRAANDAISAARKKIRDDWNIPLKELTDKNIVKFYPAKGDKITASFEIKYRGVPLIKYKIKPKRVNKKRTREQLAVEEQKGKPRKIKGAFIAQTKQGMNVYMRTSKSRPIKIRSNPRVWFTLPIAKLYGPSAMQLYSAKQTKDVIKNKYFVQFEKEYNRLLKTKI